MYARVNRDWFAAQLSPRILELFLLEPLKVMKIGTSEYICTGVSPQSPLPNRPTSPGKPQAFHLDSSHLVWSRLRRTRISTWRVAASDKLIISMSPFLRPLVPTIFISAQMRVRLKYVLAFFPVIRHVSVLGCGCFFVSVLLRPGNDERDSVMLMLMIAGLNNFYYQEYDLPRDN